MWSVGVQGCKQAKHWAGLCGEERADAAAEDAALEATSTSEPPLTDMAPNALTRTVTWASAPALQRKILGTK